jgi:hypothetical protein
VPYHFVVRNRAVRTWFMIVEPMAAAEMSMEWSME